MNILLVDDDNYCVWALTKILKRNHTIRTAYNGLDALIIFQEGHINVVITDIEMPEMNGIELLKAIRKEDKHAYVIIHTGDPSEKYESDAKRYGAYAFFIKPLDVNRLMDTLDRIKNEII